MPDKQVIQTTHDGLNITWQRDATGNQSAQQAGDFIVGVASAVQHFKKRDPRLWPRTRATLKALVWLGLGATAGVLLVSAPRAAQTPQWQVEAGATPRASSTERAVAAVTRAANRATHSVSPAPSPAQIVATDPPELVQAKRHLSTAVFDYLVQKTRVELGRAEVHDNADGTHDVWVPVAWHVDPAPVMAALNAYFWNVDHGPLETRVDFSSDFNPPVPGTLINRHFNQTHNRKFVYAEELLDWLSSWQLRVVVGLGERTGVVTLASGREYFLIKCKGVGRDQYQFQFNHAAGDKTLLFSNTGAERDPVVIANVPAAAVRGSLGDVESRLEWTKLP
jgi:hypothetical protein